MHELNYWIERSPTQHSIEYVKKRIVKMRIALNKIYLAMGLMVLATGSTLASNYFDKEENCLQVSDIQNIEGHFKQFQDFTKSGGKEVCRDEVGEKWFEVVRTVLAMERLKVTDELQTVEGDDLTLKPITEKDWWSYFTQRADHFIIEPSRCSANENIVAFVYPFFRDKINLCPRFFEMDSGSQIEVLMHEVRHFEGFSHVTCTQGNENGASGACDSKIATGGSYAVSVQAQVELSFVDQLTDADRILAESGAIYSVNNKFNSLPSVKYTNFVYASNNDGEIWRIPETDSAQAELVTTLKDPSYIYGNGSQFTVYPKEVTVDAYRTGKEFTSRAKSIGAYANMYNADSTAQRQDYGAISYYGVGAIVKSNQLHTFCGEQATSLSAKSFDEGSIQALPVLKNDKDEDQMFILSDSGEMFNFTCNDKTGELSITAVSSTLPADTATAFAFNKETAFVVTTSGNLKTYNMKTQSYESDLSTDSNWLNATPLRIYDVFDN